MKKLEISAQTARWIDEKDHRGSIKFIKECGFEAVDFNINSLFNRTYDAEKLTSFFDKSVEELFEYYADMKAAAKEYDIAFSQLHAVFPVYFPGEEARTKYFMDVTKKMIAVAGYLESPCIVVHPWRNPYVAREEEIAINMNLYRELMPVAKQYRVKICLENLFYMKDRNFIAAGCTTPEEACMYIDSLNEEAGEDLFGFCLDVGHVKCVNGSLYRFIKTLGKERLTTLHIHDNNGTYDAHMIPYTQMNTEGLKLAIDWEGFIQGLKEIEYEGALAFEIMNAITIIPPELKPAALKYIAEIGKYFRNRIEE